MNFLELTSFIGGPQGYADSPEFLSDIWPLISRNGKEIRNVFLFPNSSSRSLDWPGHYEFISKNIVHIHSMDELTKRELSQVKHLSFYGGHLNVLYQVATESSLLRELCGLYPSVSLSSDDIDQLGLNQESLTALRAFTAALPKELLQFSFGHDGDPLFIFGELEALRALLRTYYAST